MNNIYYTVMKATWNNHERAEWLIRLSKSDESGSCYDDWDKNGEKVHVEMNSFYTLSSAKDHVFRYAKPSDFLTIGANSAAVRLWFDNAVGE